MEPAARARGMRDCYAIRGMTAGPAQRRARPVHRFSVCRGDYLMNTTHMHRDFAAFLAKLKNSAGRLERRDVPDLEKLADGLEQLARTAGPLRADLSALQQRFDDVERKLARPGAPLPGRSAASERSTLKFKVNGRDVPLLRGPEDIRTFYGSRADSGADIPMADFVRGVANLNASPEARAVLNTGTDADGGYMVPHRLMGSVLEALVPESAVMQAGAGILAMDSMDFGAKTVTVAAVDTVPTAAWRAESGNVSESSPGFRAVVMTARSLSFYFRTSREWLADAVGTDAALVTAIAQAFGKELDRAALRGSGTAPEPRGVLNTAGIIAVGNGANGASLATTKYANMFTAVQQVLEANGPMPTAAIMSPRSRVVLGQAADSTGQPLQVPPMLAPVRMLHTSQVPNNLTVGTSTDCTELYLGDWTRLAYAMRERMSIQRLDEAFATSGQVGFLCHVRADVALLYPKAFAVVTGVRP
ncbi:MAG: phage major capsid protein [Rubrivivax sp.]|nr:phage major capsid protein [Rubrivivax sp.]